MVKFRKNIDKQIESNHGKNIFHGDNALKFKFVDDTIKAITEMNDSNIDSLDILIDYATVKAIEEFCKMNQYYTFNRQAINDLRNIYLGLLSSIKTKKYSLETIETIHYQNLKWWLQKTNPFAEKIYSGDQTDIKPVACSEYSADLQINILKIKVKTLMQPVLDIGCGKQGNLVKHFCQLGFVTKGIDRFSFSDDNLMNTDWLEYDYGIEKWGTILSNLGFSNHFKHHNLREDGNYIEYAKKYIDILNSLKIGGRFHYAPDLPFIELYLDKKKYAVEKYAVGDYDFKTTVIQRLN